MKIKADSLRASCTRTLGLETKLEKRWFIAAFVLLFLYLWLCQYLRIFLANNDTFGQIWPVIFSAVQVLPLCCFGVMFFGKLHVNPTPADSSATRFRRFFPAIVSILTFGYLLLWLIAYYPGGFTPDSISQLEQVLTGNYNNWHPVLHTWLSFWIPWKLFHSPAGIILYQILLFSLAVGYLYRVLCRRGCPVWFLIGSWLFLIMNYHTMGMMISPLKDSVLSIVSLVVFTQVIEIYESRGLWLKKWNHFLVFTVVCFLASGVRHNGILLIAPLYIILFVFQKDARKPIVFSAVLVLFGIWFMNGPIMFLERVCPPSNRQGEVLGMPMTILSSVYMKDRSVLSPEAIRFLDSLATQEEWNTIFEFGSFNSIKFVSSLPLQERVEQEGMAAILKYTVEAISRSPIWSTKAFITLTQEVWDPLSNVGGFVPHCSDHVVDGVGITAENNETLIQILTQWGETTDSLFLSLFTKNVGMMLLMALFAAVANVGRGKLGRAFMVFPMLIYDFGTMLLLTGGDFRFFHVSFVIIVPLLYLILSGSRNNESEPNP